MKQASHKRPNIIMISLILLLQKTIWRFLKKLKKELPYELTLLLLGIHPKELKAGSWRAIYTLCLLQHCSQQPKDGSSTNVHQQMSGQRKCGIYIQMEHYSTIKTTLPFATTWMDLEGIMKYTHTHTHYSHLYIYIFIGKDPDAEKDWRQKEKSVVEDEMVR